MRRLKAHSIQKVCFLLICAAWCYPVGVVQAGEAGYLTVLVTNLKSNNGSVRIGLNNSREMYLSRGKIPSFRAGISTIQNNTARYTFRDIPFGEYTVKLYHDENDNDQIDVNFLGIPTEKYAFSNNARGFLGLPRYDKAKFDFASGQMTMEITMP